MEQEKVQIQMVCFADISIRNSIFTVYIYSVHGIMIYLRHM